ncbi:hypothetical protein AAH994_12005 [Weeksellaceae bacterium A-14]
MYVILNDAHHFTSLVKVGNLDKAYSHHYSSTTVIARNGAQRNDEATPSTINR